MDQICVIEDDVSIRELIACTLDSAGFRSAAFESAEAFLKVPEEKRARFRLILLDIMLPGMDGIALFEKLKAGGADTPVIFLTAKNTELDKVSGLNMGAYDYIAKPFGVLELIARVKAALRHTQKAEPADLQAGVIKMDTAKRKVSVNGEPVDLTFKEFEMLRYFMLNRDIVISRERFLEKIWGVDTFIETRTVDMHVKTLRGKLLQAGGYIKTVRSVGYELSLTGVEE